MQRLALLLLALGLLIAALLAVATKLSPDRQPSTPGSALLASPPGPSAPLSAPSPADTMERGGYANQDRPPAGGAAPWTSPLPKELLEELRENAAEDEAPSWRLLRFVAGEGGQPRPASARVGAPGLYPPMSLDTDDTGTLHLPRHLADRLHGAPFEIYELLVRSHDGDHGFWGDLDPTGVAAGAVEDEVLGHDVRLVPAAPLVIEILDPQGKPLPGGPGSDQP